MQISPARISTPKSYKSTITPKRIFFGDSVKTAPKFKKKNETSLKEAMIEVGVIIAGILSDTLFFIAYPFLFIYKALKKFQNRQERKQ